jgi:Ca2+-binding RTX toxin-like protein
MATIYGTSGNDSSPSFVGTATADTMYGLEGNDILDGLSGADTLYGGAGNDTYVVDNAGDSVVENAASEGTADTVQSSVTYTLGANVENLQLLGTGNLNGTGNSLYNVLYANGGNNVLNGDAGYDFASYLYATAGVTVSLAVTTAQATGGSGSDTLLYIERLTGSDYADTLTGNSGDNILYGGAGADILTDGYGNDLLKGNDGDDTLDSGAGADYLYGGAGNDTLSGGEGDDPLMNGDDGDDTLDGGAGADYLYGGNGNDTLLGGAGNDHMDEGGDSGNNILDGGAGADYMGGGNGNDTYIVDNMFDWAGGELNGGGIDTVKSSVSYFQYNDYIENLILTGTAAIDGTGDDLDNTITGNIAVNGLDGGLGNDILDGGAGDDYLYGGAGNDILDGGAGADYLYGGAGNDTYVVDNAGDSVTEASSAGTDLVQASVSYVLGTDVENLTLTGTGAINGSGNGLNNTLTGNSAANTLLGYGGADTLTGGAGNDTYGVADAGDVVVEQTGEGTDTVNSYITYTLGDYVENLTLNDSAAINGTGNGLNNTLAGNSAANTLSGDAGNDYLPGHDGNDTLNGGNDNDTLDGGDGNDTLDGGSGNDLLNGWADADTLTGGLGADTYAFGTVPNGTNADTVTDFVSGTDTLRFRSDSTLLNIGDGDTVLDSKVSLAGPSGFANTEELVVVTGNISGDITNTSYVANAIGSANSAYTTGWHVLFAVDDGSQSAVYYFTAIDADAAVESNELQLIGTLQNTPSTVLTDYTFA